MNRRTYYLTDTALVHLEKAIRDTARRWDLDQAATYRDALLNGFQDIAENHKGFNFLHRNDLAKGTDFSLHLVEHHYVAFKARENGDVIIVGLFYERMNIPVRLKELQCMSLPEIAALEDEIEREAAEL